MMQGSGAGGSLALRMACLAASVGLHAGLVAVGWESFGTARVESAPMMVTLADGPSDGTWRALDPASPGVRVRQASLPAAGVAARPRVVPATPAMQVSSTAAPVASPQCAVPETTVVAAPIPEMPAGMSKESVVAGSGVLGSMDISDGGVSAGGSLGRAGHDLGVAAGPASTGLILATPRYASNPKPDYPRLARQNRWEGVVQLRALISAAGEVETLFVENSSGHQSLDSSALDGVRRWRFIPARHGDSRVPCEVRIPVAFRLDR